MSTLTDEIVSALIEALAIYFGSILLAAGLTGYSVYKMIAWIL